MTFCHLCGRVLPDTHHHFKGADIKEWCGFKYTGDTVPPNRLFAEETLRQREENNGN